MTAFELPSAKSTELLEKLQQAKWLCSAELPSAATLGEMLDTAFSASLGEEEGRKISLAIGYAKPGSTQGAGAFSFEPIQFSDDNIIKMAPAFDPDRTYVAVGQGSDGRLMIWGFVHNGGQEMMRGSARIPPHVIIRILRPGVIAVEFQRKTVLLYWRGASKILADDVSVLGIISRSLPEWGQVPLSPGAVVIQGIANRMLRHGHGGMILLVPSDVEEIPGITFPRGKIVGGSLFVEPHAAGGAVGGASAISVTSDHVDFLGRLTAVDGALVLDAKMRLRGFGARVDANDRGGKDDCLYFVTDPIDLSRRRLVLSEFTGTRHPAALRFCAAQPDHGVAIVASQDGDVSVFVKPRGARTVEVYRPFTCGLGFFGLFV